MWNGTPWQGKGWSQAESFPGDGRVPLCRALIHSVSVRIHTISLHETWQPACYNLCPAFAMVLGIGNKLSPALCPV